MKSTEEFQYLAVLISIVLGLGLTQLLTGVGRLARARARVQGYWPPAVRVGLLLLIDVQSGWAMFDLRGHREWTLLTSSSSWRQRGLWRDGRLRRGRRPRSVATDSHLRAPMNCPPLLAGPTASAPCWPPDAAPVRRAGARATPRWCAGDAALEGGRRVDAPTFTPRTLHRVSGRPVRHRPRRLRTVVALASTVAVALAGALPARAVAQATLVGSVRDSLAGGRPLAGARVELAPAAALASSLRVATADSAGRFAFPDVAPGRYLLGFSHLRLDTLAVEPAPRIVDVPAVPAVPTEAAPPRDVSLDVPLAIPSPRTIAEAICGPLPPGTGAVIGQVSGATAPSAALATGASPSTEGVATHVGAWWREPQPAAGALPGANRAVAVPVGPGGRYALCAVPTHTTIHLEPVVSLALTTGAGDPGAGGDRGDHAVRALTEPEMATVADSAPLAYRHLVVGVYPPPTVGGAPVAEDASSSGGPDARAASRPGSLLGSVSGVVRDSAGVPVGASRVSVAFAAGGTRVVRANADGVFRLTGLPPGWHRVAAAAIGHAPGGALVRLDADGTAAIDVVLGSRVAVLDRVTVRASRIRSDTEFGRRMLGGTGRYLTGDDVERLGGRTAADVLVRSGALKRLGTTRTGHPVFSGIRRECPVSTFVDGVEFSDFDAVNQFAPPGAIGGIEVYNLPEFAPMPYVRGRCAVVLIWTKRRVYR